MESCSSNYFWKYIIVIFYFALILSKNYLHQIAFSVIFLIYDLLLFSIRTTLLTEVASGGSGVL